MPGTREQRQDGSNSIPGIPAAIRLVRTINQQTQVELGLSKSFLSDLESGKRTCSHKSLVLICAKLNIPLFKLIFLASVLAKSSLTPRDLLDQWLEKNLANHASPTQHPS